MSVILPYIIGSFVVSWLCGMISIPLVIRFCNSRGILDQPNVRKVHKSGVPRLGGVCFVPSMLVAFVGALLLLNYNSPDGMVTANLWSCMFLVSLLLIYVTGLIDDLAGINAKAKFVVQIVAASVLPACSLYINNLYGFLGIYEIPAYIGVPLTILAMVFVNNAMNLIDGIDGLCGSLSLMVLAGFLYCFVAEGLTVYGLLIAALMGTLAAFLRYNLFGDERHHRKIFMGDSGSLTLGFILGFLMVKYSMHNPSVMPYNADHIMLATTLLLVPCFDVVRVVISRMAHRRGIFTADKNHIHHKLLRAGLGQHQALAVILLMAVFYFILNMVLSFATIYFSLIIVIDIVLWAIGNTVLNAVIRRHGGEPFV